MSVSGRVTAASEMEWAGMERSQLKRHIRLPRRQQQQQQQGNGRFKSEISLTASVITVITTAR